jgi:hypothetical protein
MRLDAPERKKRVTTRAVVKEGIKAVELAFFKTPEGDPVSCSI